MEKAAEIYYDATHYNFNIRFIWTGNGFYHTAGIIFARDIRPCYSIT